MKTAYEAPTRRIVARRPTLSSTCEGDLRYHKLGSVLALWVFAQLREHCWTSHTTRRTVAHLILGGGRCARTTLLHVYCCASLTGRRTLLLHVSLRVSYCWIVLLHVSYCCIVSLLRTGHKPRTRRICTDQRPVVSYLCGSLFNYSGAIGETSVS